MPEPIAEPMGPIDISEVPAGAFGQTAVVGHDEGLRLPSVSREWYPWTTWSAGADSIGAVPPCHPTTYGPPRARLRPIELISE